MRDASNRKTNFIQDEFATAYDTALWSPVVVGTGAVSVATAKLKLNVPANLDVAGIVTKLTYYMRNIKLSVANVDVATSAPARAGIVIAKTKVTDANPEVLQNSLRIFLDAVNSKLTVISDVAGAEVTLYNAAWTDGDGKLTLTIEPDGYFTVHEDAVLRLSGTLPFAGSNQAIFTNYIYLYTYGLAGTTGYGLLDNFQLDLDDFPTGKVTSGGVRGYAEKEMEPVWGRLVDMDGATAKLQTDEAISATPTRKIILSRDCKKIQLIGIRAVLVPTAVETAGIALFGNAEADDATRYQQCFFSCVNTSIAGSVLYVKSPTDAGLGGVAKLDTQGQVAINIDWSGAPGVTYGAIVLICKELE